jgi:hypothetical protein
LISVFSSARVPASISFSPHEQIPRAGTTLVASQGKFFDSNQSKMADRKAVIKNADMSEDMQQGKLSAAVFFFLSTF